MVHVCLSSAELIDPSTNVIDTLCIVGTAKTYGNDFVSWVCKDVLSVVLTSPSTSLSSSSLTGDDGNDDDRASKKRRVVGSIPSDETITLLQSILSRLKASPDFGVSTEVWLPITTTPPNDDNGNDDNDFDDEQLLVRVVLIVLPDNVSRHNAPSNPYCITTMLKRHVRPNESTAIIPLVESSDHVRSTICAIARVGGGLLYNRKTTTTTTTTTTTGGSDPNNNSGTDSKASSSSKPHTLLVGGISISETSIPSMNHLRVLFAPTIMVTSPITKDLQAELASLALGIQLTRRLVDAPSNELHTTAFKEQALAVVHGMDHVTTHVIEGKDLETNGYGALYSVGKAAIHPPALVVLSYNPPTADKDMKSIVLVGKGIVFDTGGLQIKTKPHMPGMKRDMGGAAAVLSAFGACVLSKKPTSKPLHAILCLAENSVDQTAFRPDDIITMLSGKTVEINNTDAEGRLVLGDGVASAVKYLNPYVIIDMATMTGAQGVATGRYFGALYCNDERLEQIAVQSGVESGDLCHPMPYAPELFKQEYTSSVADMKNSVADRENAQVSAAGQFIGNQMEEWLTEDGGRWCHIDMAYPVYDKRDERATGYGVGLLYTMVEKLDQDMDE